MCEYIKSRFPHIYLYTSTNGLAFTEDQARRLVHSGIDEVTFSIDGATPESYATYRQRGDFAKAIRNLRAAADEKRRDRPRRAVPQLALHPVHAQRQRRRRWTWRGDGGRDRRRSPVLGADRPPRGHVLAPLLPGHARARRDPARDLGRQQPRQRDSRRHAAGRDRRRQGPLAGRSPGDSPRHGRTGQPLEIADDRPQPLDAAVPGAGQLRPPPGAPRRAALRRRTARSSTATSSAPGCPATLQPGATVDVPITITAPDDTRAATR